MRLQDENRVFLTEVIGMALVQPCPQTKGYLDTGITWQGQCQVTTKAEFGWCICKLRKAKDASHSPEARAEAHRSGTGSSLHHQKKPALMAPWS